MRCRKCGAQLLPGMKTCPECSTVFPMPYRIIGYIAKIEEFLLAAALGAMILLVLVQIILRNDYASGIIGGAEIVRHLVLWVAFLGAMLAAREDKHIRIELAGHIITGKLRQIFDVLTGVFSVFICSILTYASIIFVSIDYQGHTVIAFLNTPVWILQVIIPIGYLCVTLRFAIHCIAKAGTLVRGETLG